MATLDGKIALVTGAGSGIGLAIARALADAGARVALVARSADKLAALASEQPERWLAAPADVSDEAAVRGAFAAVTEAWGAPTILVNNAGVAGSAPLLKETLANWQRMMNINAAGAFLCTREAIPGMVAAGWGRLINVASIAGLEGAGYIAAYAASKHAMIGLTRCAAHELAGKGITCNALCPGYVETEMTAQTIDNIVAKTGLSADDARAKLAGASPQRRLIEPDEVAETALWLCSEGARGVNGQAISIDGGGTR